MPLKTPPIKPKQKKEESFNKSEEEILSSEDFSESLEVNQEETPEVLNKKQDQGEGSSSDIVYEELPREDVFDSKEEFFRKMAEKIKEDGSFSDNENIDNNKQENDCPSPERRISYYRKMVTRFAFLALVLVLAVLYFSLVKLNLVIHTDREISKDSVNFFAYFNGEEPDLERAVRASISKIEVEASDIFSSTGEKNLGKEIVGTVKIINNYSKNQPLVATTRLLSSDDKIFRIKNTVNVPAGGSVEVEIYADELSEDMAIGPNKFTIPGLWAGLQDKIYAESSEAFELKQDSKKFISSEDFNNAKKSLEEKIVKQMEEKDWNNKDLDSRIFVFDNEGVKITFDQEIGDEVDSFSLSVKSLVSIIAFNQNDVAKIANKKLSLLDFDQGLSELLNDSFAYTLLNFNSNKSIAEIKLDFSAKTVSGLDRDLISKKHVLNLSKKQIEAYLDGIEGINSYEINFSPKFIKRGPLLVDRVQISYK